jgi:hypothetical protein
MSNPHFGPLKTILTPKNGLIHRSNVPPIPFRIADVLLYVH